MYSYLPLATHFPVRLEHLPCLVYRLDAPVLVSLLVFWVAILVSATAVVLASVSGGLLFRVL